MTHILMELPYKTTDLIPFISRETIEYHYGKHHQSYINNLNTLIVGTEFENMSLEEIIKKSSGAIFNNSAQVWNHDFYWKSLSPQKKTLSDNFFKKIEENFGSFEVFKEKFSSLALSNFGSGWTWLVKKESGALEIVSTSNAGTIITTDDIPLLVIDIWEHAYYIDYRNVRAEYIKQFWNFVNWDFVEGNLGE
ncbi:superoxide dismutase [Candidatus Gracilibacteria bacterium]|nr:superoxide dismutase [Candidatus Gracilibacteria bacterium]NUJ99099.1 superoxide dismutase [Candidatus Gracilibacteria bacterium]